MNEIYRPERGALLAPPVKVGRIAQGRSVTLLDERVIGLPDGPRENSLC